MYFDLTLVQLVSRYLENLTIIRLEMDSSWWLDKKWLLYEIIILAWNKFENEYVGIIWRRMCLCIKDKPE